MREDGSAPGQRISIHDGAKNPEIDRFLKKADSWREETKELRRIALDCGLGEELKWGKPCYTFDDGNVAIIQGFKKRCALMFFKGALLEDPDGLLEKPGANSRAARRMMFSGVDEVTEMEGRLRAFIAAAIDVRGARDAFATTSRKEHSMPQYKPVDRDGGALIGIEIAC